MVRTESADTQDVSRQQRLEEIDTEEMEEVRFVPSAVSEPRWVVHMCDKCNEEGYKIYQLAGIVTEGGAAHTINLCKQCYNVMRLK